MTTSISGLSGNQGGEQRNAAAGTQGAAQTQDSAQDSKQDAKRSGDFRQPESACPGVTPGHVLESNEPNLSLIHI